MTYQVIWSERAMKDLDAIDVKTKDRIIARVESIKEQPYIYVKHLTGVPLYSLRVGKYRVLMNITAKQLLIFVVRVGHRKDIYDKL